MAVVVVAMSASLATSAHADRCRAHCRDVARACKLRCKASHPEGASDSRHRCLQRCELREAECRTRC
ncbi:MAG: hypothetical protein LC659_01860 [Myxococcales bacterium]|nr:hypothetical protein [Myxococcales bacterium]